MRINSQGFFIDMKTYQFNLTEQELQTIADALATQPYAKVFTLFQKLNDEVSKQNSQPSEV